MIIQKVREAEREGVYEEFKDRVGELVNGIVRRYERGDLTRFVANPYGVLRSPGPPPGLLSADPH